MSSTAIEIPYEENISLQRFWDLANDLFSTKVFYDETTNEYYTKCIKKLRCFKVSVSESEEGEQAKDFESGKGAIEVESDQEEETEAEKFDCTEDEINTLLVSYLTLVSNYCDKLTKPETEDRFYQQVSKFVIELEDYQKNLEFCVRKMLSLLTYCVDSNGANLSVDQDSLGRDLKGQIETSISTNEKLIKIIGWILIFNYQADEKEIMRILLSYQGFETVAGVLSNYSRLSQNSSEKDPYISTYSNYLELLYEMCKKHEFSSKELAYVDIEFVKFVFKSLEVTTREENEVNFLRFKLLLILNEQFMVCHYSAMIDKEKPQTENMFFQTMTEDNNLFLNFSEALILNFNREEDHVIQILILKVFYLVFTTSNTCQRFYINDLKVIIDIIIRELFNLSIVKDESLINTYLRVLYPMLLFSSLKEERYKVENLLDVLKYLNSAEQTSPVTKRLADRCLILDFFKEKEGEPVVPEPPVSLRQTVLRHDSSQSSIVSELEIFSEPPSPSNPQLLDRARSNSSSSSLDSKVGGVSRKSKKLPPPPPPPPRRLNYNNGSELSLSRSKIK